MFGPWLQYIIAGATIVMSGVGMLFYINQNRAGKMGGKIAPAKMAWLIYVVYLWFVLCPLMLLHPYLQLPIADLVWFASGTMWIRGIIELFMMYVSKNWKPPYGIAHDIFSFLGMLVGFYLISQKTIQYQQIDIWVMVLLGVIAFTFLVETVYATVFYRLVGGHTVGEDAVWFAEQNNPKFKQIVRWTAIINVPLYLFLIVFLAVGVFGL